MATASARAEATATVPGSGTATQIPRDRFPFTLSDTMRAYIDSLPDKITVRQEVTSYRFWKSLRTELISTFLFVVFSQSVLEIVNELYKQQDPKPSALGMVATGLAVLAVITSLVQATGHVSGCHLTIAITVGLFTTERVSPVRLVSYVLIQLLGSMAGMAAVFGLFGHRPSPPHLPEGIAPNQVFGFEFLATYLVVLTYLGNCDERRKDLGFKSLSIGLGWLAAHLFAFHHSGASISPARMFALALFTDEWCLHWLYWLCAVLAGIVGGLTYDYIGSSKPPAYPPTLTTTTTTTSYPGEDPQQNQSELRHRFNDSRHRSTLGAAEATSIAATATAMLSRSETMPKLSLAFSTPSPALSTLINTPSVEDLGSTEVKTKNECYNMNETRFQGSSSVSISTNEHQKY